jgi:hypothetical protein
MYFLSNPCLTHLSMKNSVSLFHALGCTRTHYVTHRSHRIQKHKFGVTCPIALFVGILPVPPEHEKQCITILYLGRTRMHYVTHRSHRMQKHVFNITCPNAFFAEFVLVPPNHEKQCFAISHPGRTGMHYMTSTSHQMQKHRFGVTCLDVFLPNLYRSHPSMKNSASPFHASDAPECTT